MLASARQRLDYQVELPLGHRQDDERRQAKALPQVIRVDSARSGHKEADDRAMCDGHNAVCRMPADDPLDPGVKAGMRLVELFGAEYHLAGCREAARHGGFPVR